MGLLARLVPLLVLPRSSDAAVIQRVFGANSSEVSHASVGGGTHVYLAGLPRACPVLPPREHC
jgi:hypothetical protein